METKQEHINRLVNENIVLQGTVIKLEAKLTKANALLDSVNYSCTSWIEERLNDYEFMMVIKELLAERGKVK